MAHHRLGRRDDAGQLIQKAIADANGEMKRGADNDFMWNRRLSLQLLRSEAEKLLSGQAKTSGVDKHAAPPK